MCHGDVFNPGINGLELIGSDTDYVHIWVQCQMRATGYRGLPWQICVFYYGLPCLQLVLGL